MYHSLTFGEGDSAKNTWDDWHLIPTSRPVINLPELKKQQISIQGGNGVIDLTSALTGYPNYENRKGSVEYLVMHSGMLSDADGFAYNNNSKSAWSGIYSEIANYLHGKYFYMTYEDEPGFYYKGRFSVGNWEPGEEYSKLTIEYDLEPFKYSVTDTSNQWEWDSFNFKTGVIRTYSGINYDTTGKTLKIVGTIVPIIPTISCSHDTIITTNTLNYDIHARAGQHTYHDLVVYPGEQQWTFKTDPSSGAVSSSASIYFRDRSM